MGAAAASRWALLEAWREIERSNHSPATRSRRFALSSASLRAVVVVLGFARGRGSCMEQLDNLDIAKSLELQYS